MRASAQINHCGSDKSTAVVGGWGGERIKGVERRKSRGSLPENIFAQPTDLMCNILPPNLSIGGFLKGLGKQPPHSSSMASNCTSSTF